MRVLVVFDDEYRAYRQVIAAGIGLLRPQVEVAACSPADLGTELGRFDPQVVLCGQAGVADPGDAAAWVELPVEPGRPGRIRVGSSRRAGVDLELEGLLAVFDEAEELVGKGETPANERGAP